MIAFFLGRVVFSEKKKQELHLKFDVVFMFDL